MTPVRIVGGYAALPADREDRRKLTAAILTLPGCDGLEIPFGSAGYAQDRDWLWDELPPQRSVVLTLVAATMEALAHDVAWGPASRSEAGRLAAVELLRQARTEVVRATQAGHRVVAVELQSAPRRSAPPGAGPAALEQTLTEAAGWDWCGAALTIEHCDAWRAGHVPAKGFLDLADEIAVAQRVTSQSHTRVGIVINWGRSAIELRSAEGPIDHLTQASDAGVLLGLMASGTAATDGPFGPAWSDSHTPVHATDARAGEPTSLLTPQRLRGAFHAAGNELLYAGLKIGIRPRDADLDHRLDLLRHSWAELHQASH